MSEADDALAQRIQRGDLTALSDVLEANQGRLFNTVLRMVNNRDDAAEITQEALLKVVEHIEDFDGRAKISTWMTRIAMNLAISHLRKMKFRRHASIDAPGAAESAGHTDQAGGLRQQLAENREPTPASRVQQREMVDHLHSAIEALDEDLRAVLVLRDIDELNYQGIAQALSIPVGTVKSRLFRARLALRHEMLRRFPPPRPPERSPAMPNPRRT